MIGNYTIKSIGTYVFDYTIDSVTIQYGRTIRNYAFYKSSISQVILKAVQFEHNRAICFLWNGLESIVIPSRLATSTTTPLRTLP